MGAPMKKRLNEHFFYKEKSIGVEKKLENAKESMAPETYEIFCKEVNKVFEKWMLLYEIAMQEPAAFNELNNQCKGGGAFKRLEESIDLGCTDELKRRYVEAKKFIVYADKWYPREDRFSIRIGLLAASIGVFIDKAIATKIHIKEINDNWKGIYSFHSKPDSPGDREPASKKLKKDDQSEETDLVKQKKSVSWDLPR